MVLYLFALLDPTRSKSSIDLKFINLSNLFLSHSTLKALCFYWYKEKTLVKYDTFILGSYLFSLHSTANTYIYLKLILVFSQSGTEIELWILSKVK